MPSQKATGEPGCPDSPVYSLRSGGPDRDRTGDLLNAIQARSQLRHGPVYVVGLGRSFLQAPQLLPKRLQLRSVCVDLREEAPEVVRYTRHPLASQAVVPLAEVLETPVELPAGEGGVELLLADLRPLDDAVADPDEKVSKRQVTLPAWARDAAGPRREGAF